MTRVPPLRRGTTMFLASLRTTAGAVTPLGRRTFSVAARSTAGLAPLDGECDPTGLASFRPRQVSFVTSHGGPNRPTDGMR